MVRVSEIQEKLLHIIGWQQNYNTSDLKISEALTASESGLYFQQVHPLLTLQNMACIAPDFKNIEFEEFNAEKEYCKGNIASYNGKLYKALNKTVNNLPDTEVEYWVETNLFSEWLEDKTKASIQKAITRYCTEKMAEGTNRPLCENRTLFDGTGRLVDTVKNRKNLVGFEIVPVRSNGVTIKINKIGLQFTKPGDYILYLMHSSSAEPIKTIKLTKVKGNSTEWFTIPDLYLPYKSEDTDAGGSWYLCYFQSELPEGSQAIRKDKDWSKEPCGSCSRREVLAWKAWSKYLEVHPFFVNEELVRPSEELPEEPSEELPEKPSTIFMLADNTEEQPGSGTEEQPSDGTEEQPGSGTEEQPGDSTEEQPGDGTEEQPKVGSLYLWDAENNQYTYDNNYGLNLEVTVSCDLTDFIIEQRLLFQDIIAKQVAVDMLREFAYNANVRTNRHSINASRLDILYELDGDSSSMKNSGLNYQLGLAFKAIKLSTSGIDRICLPCKNNGIKYRTI